MAPIRPGFEKGSISPAFKQVATEPVSLPEDVFISYITVGDFNGDGIGDVAVIGQVGTGTAPAPTLLFVGDGRGRLTDATANLLASGAGVAPSGGGRTLVADLNRDDADDLVQLGFGDDAPPFPGGTNVILVSDPLSHTFQDFS